MGCCSSSGPQGAIPIDNRDFYEEYHKLYNELVISGSFTRLKQVRNGIFRKAYAVIDMHDSIDDACEKCKKLDKFADLIQGIQYANELCGPLRQAAQKTPEILQESKVYLADIYEICSILVSKHHKLISLVDSFEKFHKIVTEDRNAKGARYENGLRVMRWVYEHFPKFECHVPPEDPDKRIETLLSAMTALHSLCEKIDQIQDKVLDKKFGTYSLRDLLGVEKKNKSEEKKGGEDSAGLQSKVPKVGFGGLTSGISGGNTQKLIDEATKKAEDYVNEKITKVINDLLKEALVDSISEKLDIPDDNFLDQEAEDANNRQKQADGVKAEDDADTEAYEATSMTKLQKEEEAKAAKQTKWIIIEIVRDPEDQNVDLVKTEARYNVDPPPPEKKTLMTKIKEGAGDAIKQYAPQAIDQLVGNN